MVRAVSVELANRNPLVFLPYPRERTPTWYLLDKRRIKYSVMGVLPVPPMAKLPTPIVGILTNEDGNMIGNFKFDENLNVGRYSGTLIGKGEKRYLNIQQY